jgi:serine/threonine protein kinase
MPHFVILTSRDWQEKIRSVREVNHIRFIETFEDEASVFLVMEFASGPSLVDYVEQNGPLPESVAIKVS